MKHSRILRLASVVLCAAVIVLAGVSASAGSVNSVMNDAGSNGSNGMSGSNGTGGMGGMMNDIEDGINDVNDMFDDRTLGDRDGDGFIENDLIDGGMSGSSSSSSSGESGMGKSMDAPDGVLNTTGRDGVDPISEGGSNAGSNGTNTEDNGVSWIGVIIAVLLAGALVAVVIALIPKRERD